MRSISLRRASDPADQSHHARAGQRFHRQVTTTSRSRWIVRVLLALILAVGIIGIVAGFSKPVQMSLLERQVAADNAKIAALEAPKYPVDSVQAAAMKAVAQCDAFTDQVSTTAVAAVETDCGWNGQGVITPIGLPQFDPNRTLQPPVQNGFTALPFDVQLMGVSGMLTYYVPVQQTGPDTAAVAGIPVPLNTTPSFIVNGCAQDTSVEDPGANSRVQAVDALVAGEPRYALPGVSITFDGNGLTGAIASNETVCTANGNYQLVLATVTYNGPTQGAQIAVGLAFSTTVISTREVRIAAVGINAAYKPQTTS
jgi:hypothetical protein